MFCFKLLAFISLGIALVAFRESRAEEVNVDEEALKFLEQSFLDANGRGESLWLNYKDTVYIYLYRGGGRPNSNLASFDMDGTLIKTKSGKTFPENENDWKLYSDWTPIRIDQVTRNDKARLVVFTNQNGVGSNQGLGLEQVKRIVEGMSQAINIPSIVFVAINKDEFRKPATGMFRLYEKAFNGQLPINLEKSFFCGDADGQAQSFSDSDKKFAQAIGAPFVSANDFLLAIEPSFVVDS